MSEISLKQGWKFVKISECCDQISERIDNPSASGLERFVGLEHMQTRETLIRKWGSTDDVTSTMKLFESGDVLVARRNVYLERAAKADFDGVCSGDAIVLRPKEKHCLPELLPFILNTNQFWAYANSQADGSMSKRLSVARLMNYEFALPPLDEQKSILRILQSSESVIQKHLELNSCMMFLHTSILFELFQNGIDESRRIRNKMSSQFIITSIGYIPRDWRIGKITEYLTKEDGLQTGPFGSSLKKKMYTKTGYRVYGQEQVISGSLLLGDYYIPPNKFQELIKFSIKENDILMSLVGTTGKILVVRQPFEPGIINPRLIRLRPNDTKVDINFLRYLLMSPQVRHQFAKYATGGTMDVLSGQTFRRVRIPIIPVNEQKRISRIVQNLESNYLLQEQQLEKLRKLKKTLLEKLLR